MTDMASWPSLEFQLCRKTSDYNYRVFHMQSEACVTLVAPYRDHQVWRKMICNPKKNITQWFNPGPTEWWVWDQVSRGRPIEQRYSFCGMNRLVPLTPAGGSLAAKCCPSSCFGRQASEKHGQMRQRQVRYPTPKSAVRAGER